jgi:hypothetical protein
MTDHRPDEHDEHDERVPPDHRRDLFDGSVSPAVASVRGAIDGGLVAWARRRAETDA